MLKTCEIWDDMSARDPDEQTMMIEICESCMETEDNGLILYEGKEATDPEAICFLCGKTAEELEETSATIKSEGR